MIIHRTDKCRYDTDTVLPLGMIIRFHQLARDYHEAADSQRPFRNQIPVPAVPRKNVIAVPNRKSDPVVGVFHLRQLSDNRYLG